MKGYRGGREALIRRSGRAFRLKAAVFFCIYGLVTWSGLNLACADSQVPRITVEDMAFTLAIQPDREPAGKISSIAVGQQPYLWTRLTGNQVILDQLRAEGKLPIYHYWRQFVNDVPVGEARSEELEKDIPLDLGLAAVVNKLQSEIDDRRDKNLKAVFDWRTWSHKLSLEPGQWMVFVYYADKSPVICVEPDGTLVNCGYPLLVREAP